MFVTIINDCRDANAVGRQCTRVASLFGVGPSFVSVASDIEAAGNLVDALDASGGREGVILVNVAPRNGTAHAFANGTPFGFFRYDKTLVVTTIAGHTLALVNRFKIATALARMDIRTVLAHMAREQKLDPALIDHISWSQFRSFDFAPLAAHWLVSGEPLPAESYALDEIASIDSLVWAIDCFGNCKTTLLPDDIGFAPGARIKTAIGELACVTHLRDVADDTAALTIGSSGIGAHRFLEIAVQGKSAAARFGISIGDHVMQ